MKQFTILRNFVVAVIILLSTVEVFSQVNFEIMYGGADNDRGVIVELTSDGGYIVGGSTASFGNGDLDLYLIKIRSTGDVEWSKTYSTPQNERIHGVKQTQDGDYYIIGWKDDNYGWFDILMMKVDSNGNQLWAKSFGSVLPDEPRGLSITADGGILVSGYVASFGFGTKDIQIIKLDSGGNIEWAKTVGTIYEDHNARNLAISDGNYLFAGETDFTGWLNWTPTLIKTDTLGNIIWARRYPGTVEDWVRSIIELSSGGFVMAGNTASFGSGQNDAYIIRTDADGHVLWVKAIGGIADDIAYSVVESSDGKLVVSGYTNSFGFGGFEAFLFKMDMAGNLEWFHNFGGINNEYVYDMKKTNDDGFIITGRRLSDSMGGYDAYVIKTDANGITDCGFFDASPIVMDAPVNDMNANFGITSIISEDTPSYVTNNLTTQRSILCRVIPVELGSFNSKVENGTVTLFWETVTETNNFGFEIQRDKNKIGFIEGAGTSTQKHSYTFIDNNVGTGEYEYRIIQIDYDGTREEIVKTMIDVNFVPDEFILYQNYPNPFNPSTKIKYTVPEENFVSLKIYDLLGKEVKTLVEENKLPGVYSVDVNADNLPSGIYIYTLRAGSFVASKKMILMK